MGLEASGERLRRHLICAPLCFLWLFLLFTLSIWSSFSHFRAISGMRWEPGVDQVWVYTWVGALNRVQKMMGQIELKRKPKREDGAAQGRGRREVLLQPFPPRLAFSRALVGRAGGRGSPSPALEQHRHGTPSPRGRAIPLSESLRLTHIPVVTHWTMCSEQSSFQREENSSGGVS